MNGIGAMTQGAPAPQQQPAGNEDGEQPNVSPEEQEAYDQFMANALRIIYPEGGEEGQISPNVMKGLQGSDNPVMNLATTAVTIVTGLRDSAKRSNHMIDDAILFHGGQSVVEELADVADAAGIHDYSEDDLEQAWYVALDMYRSAGEQTGDVDKEALTQGWEAIKQADAQGRLGEVLPGIEARMKHVPKGDEE